LHNFLIKLHKYDKEEYVKKKIYIKKCKNEELKNPLFQKVCIGKKISKSFENRGFFGSSFLSEKKINKRGLLIVLGGLLLKNFTVLSFMSCEVAP